VLNARPTRNVDGDQLGSRAAPAPDSLVRVEMWRSGRFGGDVGKARRAKRLLLRAFAEAAGDSRTCAGFVRDIPPAIHADGRRRPLADTPLRHKHEGIEGERYGCGPRTTAGGIAASPPNRPETPKCRPHTPQNKKRLSASKRSGLFPGAVTVADAAGERFRDAACRGLLGVVGLGGSLADMQMP
jgi:hypothetical protein